MTVGGGHSGMELAQDYATDQSQQLKFDMPEGEYFEVTNMLISFKVVPACMYHLVPRHIIPCKNYN